MTSADFSPQALLRLSDFFFFLLHVSETSPGKSDNFPLIHLPHLHDEISGSIGLRFVMQAHPSHHALYVISVRQTEGLPPASFRFGLTTDTLALG